MILHFSLQLFHFKTYRSRCRSRWENLDRGQYPLQPIKFVNLVVPSPCETEPCNKSVYSWAGGGQHNHVKLYVYFKLNYKSRYEFRGRLLSFALFCKRNGTALHITEEDANPLNELLVDRCLGRVGLVGWCW